MTETAPLETLHTAKAALDEGLISAADFDAVKAAFLRAQQFKAGLDAGFIKPEDYEHVKERFLSAIEGLQVDNFAAVASRSTERRAPGDVPFPVEATSIEGAAPPEVAEPALEPAKLSNFGEAAAGHGALAAPVPPSPLRPTTEVPTNIPRLGGALRKSTGPSTSMSGIMVTEDAINLFYYMKAKAAYRWATWRLNDAGNEVVIANVGDKDSSYADFLAALPVSDCRYGVFDYQITNSEGTVFNKLLFVSWAPDSSRIKSKMMYASTKDFFKGYLEGLNIEMQVNDIDELDEKEVAEAVRSTLARK